MTDRNDFLPTDAKTAEQVMLREFGLADGMEHEAGEFGSELPRSCGWRNLLSYCEQQGRCVADEDAKVAAKAVTAKLQAFHAGEFDR